MNSHKIFRLSGSKINWTIEDFSDVSPSARLTGEVFRLSNLVRENTRYTLVVISDEFTPDAAIECLKFAVDNPQLWLRLDLTREAK